MRTLFAIFLLAIGTAATCGSTCSIGRDNGYIANWTARPTPERVCLSSELADFGESLDAAMDIWNHAADRTVFVASCEKPTVLVCHVPTDGDFSMRAFLSRPTAVIEVARAVDVLQFTLDIGHELGHVLGLAHDDYGMMAPYSRWEAFGNSRPARITDGDRERLRNERYRKDTHDWRGVASRRRRGRVPIWNASREVGAQHCTAGGIRGLRPGLRRWDLSDPEGLN